MSAGFKGTNLEQDVMFSKKNEKLLKSLKYPEVCAAKVLAADGRWT
jgi:hypothetical protein